MPLQLPRSHIAHYDVDPPEQRLGCSVTHSLAPPFNKVLRKKEEPTYNHHSTLLTPLLTTPAKTRPYVRIFLL